MSYLSPGTCHPLRGRTALQVTAHPRGGPALFGALGLWQCVAALPALTQDHTVPVAGTAAGCALRKEIWIRAWKVGTWRPWEGAAGGQRGHEHEKQKLLSEPLRGQQLYKTQLKSQLSSCKTAGHNSSHTCAITTLHKMSEKKRRSSDTFSFGFAPS